MTQVAIKDLNKSFEAGRRVVRDFSLTIEPGEMVGLLGPSGCGKTTVLRLLCGLEEPDSGCISFNGETICNGETSVPPERRGIGMVFQDYALWPHMTVWENVAFGLREQRLARRTIALRTEEALELVGMMDHVAKHPHQLSGGEQQRVAIARALALKPQVLLLDEALSNLDKKIRHEMRLEIKRLQRQLEITTLFVTHDQEDAMVMADRIAVMRDGGIEQVGPASEVYARPRNLFVAGFIGESNVLAGVVTDPEERQVLTPVGPLRYTNRDRTFAPHSLVGVVIRPEHFRLAPGGIQGYVNEIVFRGGSLQVLLQVRCTWLKVDLRETAAAPQVGDRLQVHPQEVILVDEVPDFARNGQLTAPPPTGVEPVAPMIPDMGDQMRGWLELLDDTSGE